jgi:hypothetical protein
MGNDRVFLTTIFALSALSVALLPAISLTM